MVNFVFGACAWELSFGDKTAEDGTRIDGTLVADNYVIILAVLVVSRYPLNRAFMKEIDRRNKEKDQEQL